MLPLSDTITYTYYCVLCLLCSDEGWWRMERLCCDGQHHVGHCRRIPAQDWWPIVSGEARFTVTRSHSNRTVSKTPNQLSSSWALRRTCTCTYRVLCCDGIFWHLQETAILCLLGSFPLTWSMSPSRREACKAEKVPVRDLIAYTVWWTRLIATKDILVFDKQWRPSA